MVIACFKYRPCRVVHPICSVMFGRTKKHRQIAKSNQSHLAGFSPGFPHCSVFRAIMWGRGGEGQHSSPQSSLRAQCLQAHTHSHCSVSAVCVDVTWRSAFLRRSKNTRCDHRRCWKRFLPRWVSVCVFVCAVCLCACVDAWIEMVFFYSTWMSIISETKRKIHGRLKRWINGWADLKMVERGREVERARARRLALTSWCRFFFNHWII